MDVVDLARATAAVASQGSPDHTAPSGPTLTLLRAFASEGKFAEMVDTFSLFREAKRGDWRHIADEIPKIIQSQVFFKEGKVDPRRFIEWNEKAHKDWAKELIDCVEFARPEKFDALVKSLNDEVQKL